MGWTYTHREPGLSTAEFFTREFPTMLGERGRILASGMVNGTFYAAVRNNDDLRVWALVILTARARGHHNFGYKEMSETMLPVAEAPARVLDLLTDTTDEDALEWRKRCRAYNDRAATRKVRPGDTVRFAEPIRFTNGQELTEFVYVSGSDFKAGYRPYRIRQWRDRAYEVIPAPASPAESGDDFLFAV